MRKQVIVVRAKDNTYSLDASTPELWAANALALLTERWKEGWWYEEPDDGTQLLDEAKRMLEVADPDSTAYKEIARRIEYYERDLKAEAKHAAWYAEAERVVTEQDASVAERIRRIGDSPLTIPTGWPVAWALLWHRRDHEYEGVSLDEVRSMVER